MGGLYSGMVGEEGWVGYIVVWLGKRVGGLYSGMIGEEGWVGYIVVW